MTSITRHISLDATDYELADLRAVVDIDRDLPNHDGRWANESWFVVANLDADDDRLGFQVHVLLMDLPGAGAVVSVNAVVVNETADWSESFEYAYPLDAIEIRSDRFSISTPELTITGDRDRYTLRLEGNEVKLHITGEASAPPVLMNGQGQTLFIDVDQYEYAFPAMTTTGSITRQDATIKVTGISWLDRQWGDLPDFFKGSSAGAESFDSMNWLWSNVQLDNGTNIALGQVRDIRNRKLFLGLTAVDPAGTHLVLNRAEPIETSDYWTSPATGRRYPTRCVFRAPQTQTELIIEVPYKDQEIVSKLGGLTKYEGAALISGTHQGQPVTGRGYLELVGHWA